MVMGILGGLEQQQQPQQDLLRDQWQTSVAHALEAQGSFCCYKRNRNSRGVVSPFVKSVALRMLDSGQVILSEKDSRNFMKLFTDPCCRGLRVIVRGGVRGGAKGSNNKHISE